jgi:hypothetical protein
MDGVEPAESPKVVESAQRSERTPKDMAVSLLVLLVPIALLLLFYRFVLDGDEPVRVDPAPTVATARAANVFPISEPTGLDDGWIPVSASWQPVDGGRVLRIGYVTPDGAGVQVVQTNAPVDSFLPIELTDKARPEGSVGVGGTAWQAYTSRPGERALVLLEPDRTVYVLGSASQDELRELAASLK